MPAVAPRDFISCDWGTSHFRLKWVEQGEVIAAYHDENGCKKLRERTERCSPAERRHAFEYHLQTSLNQVVESKHPVNPRPLLVSGMASSTIGWIELPYARAPMPLKGPNLKVQPVSWNQPPFVARTWLISGIATETNMMRGEETEALGLLSAVPKAHEPIVVILPGTHSKHLHISGGILREIRTYMTGELYSVFSKHSILAASIAPTPAFNAPGFFAGADAAVQQGLAASLFQTRTRQVLAQRPPEENAAFLSGLLIGEELKALVRTNSGEVPLVLLGGAPQLRNLYSEALKHLAHPNWRAFSDAECETAVVRGHEIILSHLSSRSET